MKYHQKLNRRTHSILAWIKNSRILHLFLIRKIFGGVDIRLDFLEVLLMWKVNINLILKNVSFKSLDLWQKIQLLQKLFRFDMYLHSYDKFFTYHFSPFGISNTFKVLDVFVFYKRNGRKKYLFIRLFYQF